MFESAELGQRIDKATYKAELPQLREALLDAQYELAQKKPFPVILIIGGTDGAGKGLIVNTLNYWMDPRHIHTHAMGEASDEEKARPLMWRFWRKLPPKGSLGVFFGSWYTEPMLQRAYGKGSEAEFDTHIDEILRFEHMLANEGALVLKFWLHLSKKAMKTRLKELEASDNTTWRVSKLDWDRYKNYEVFRSMSEHMLRRTSLGHAPWMVVESVDDRFRDITVGQTLLKALQDRLASTQKPAAPVAPVAMPELVVTTGSKNILDSLDLSKAYDKPAYKKHINKFQARLNQLSRSPKFKDRAVVMVFEGNDAAGKGGSIRRVAGALDSRFCDIIPVAAPTDEERAHPYLWRFWRHVPGKGCVTIFDRSWYGRVLVERVEGFCDAADWSRAYNEINDFENQMDRYGVIVLKFWLSISKEEQLQRFNDREATGYKRFKLTDEDWRNRDKWDDYARAVCDMVERTSTERAPWTLVEANNKYFARIKVLETLCNRLEKEGVTLK